MVRDKLLGLVTAATLTAFGLSPTLAQSSSTRSPPAASEVPKSAEGSGTTSGPASGTPTTLGSGGTTPATPHQLEGIKEQSSSVSRETEQSIGIGANQAPRGPAVGVKGSEGSESGPTAGETAERAKQ